MTRSRAFGGCPTASAGRGLQVSTDGGLVARGRGVTGGGSHRWW